MTRHKLFDGSDSDLIPPWYAQCDEVLEGGHSPLLYAAQAAGYYKGDEVAVIPAATYRAWHASVWQIADEMEAWAEKKMSVAGSSRIDRTMVREWAKRLREP